MELAKVEKSYEVTRLMEALHSTDKMLFESPQANKMDDDDERTSPSRLESKESSGSTTVESNSRDGDCNTCLYHPIEHNIIQEKMSESGFVKTESQSSETTELPTEEDIQLQYNSTVNKSTGRSKELYEMHSRTIAKLTERRKVDEIEGCTFKPKVTSAAAHMSRATKHQPIHELLFAEASIQREKQQQKLTEHPKPTFAPDMKLTAGSPFSKRSQIKMQEDQSGHVRYEARQAVMRQLEKDVYGECTFTPQIFSNKNNSNATISPCRPSPERLYKSGIQEREISENKWKEEAVTRELEGCTFSPRISHLAASSGLTRDKGVHERLYSEATLISKRLNAKAETNEVEKLKQCTFQPSVGKTPTTTTAVHERLFSHATSLAEERLQAMLDLRNMDENCTFTPKTNNDAMLDPNRTEVLYKMGVEDQRARAQSPRDYGKALSDKIEAEDLKTCTFVPDRSQTKNADPLACVTAGTKFIEDGISTPTPPVPPIWERLYMHATTSTKLKEKLCEDAIPIFMPTLVSKWPPQQKAEEHEIGIPPPLPPGDNGLIITPPPVPTAESSL